MKVKLDQLAPKLRERIEKQMAQEDGRIMLTPCQTNYAIQPQAKRLTPNKTESRFKAILQSRQYNPIWEQAITLKLDAPFKSYRPDYAVLRNGVVMLFEVKARHRFARAGIAKAALAAKTYPQFQFVLAMWEDGKFTETVL